MDSTKQNTSAKYSLAVQIIVAVVFAFLNLALNRFCDKVLKIPLFMDMVFIYAAGFFGLVSGVLCAAIFSLSEFLFITRLTDNLPYIICSVTGVLILRFCIRKMGGASWTTLLLCALLSAIAISIEGGIIYTLLFSELSLADFAPTVYLTCQLMLSNIPLLSASILARIPVNIADKLIAVFAGYGVFVLTKRMGCIDKAT